MLCRLNERRACRNWGEAAAIRSIAPPPVGVDNIGGMPSRMPVAVFVFGMNARRIGGIEVHTRELVSQLAARGCRSVLCFCGPPSPVVREYLSSPNVTWEELPRAGENSLRAGRDLSRLLRRYQPAVLHLQFTRLHIPAWIARLSGVRHIVFTDHLSRPQDYVAERRMLWKRLAGQALHAPLSWHVSVSDYNRRIVTVSGTLPESVSRRIHNGVDLTRAVDVAAGNAFRERHGIAANRILIMQISQIIPQKGIADVLDAAAIALSKNPNLHFSFVGDGQYLKDFMQRSKEMGIGGHVTWAGLIEDPIAEGAFAAADVICLASRWQEAFGLVIAEAMSCAKPVIATQVGGVPEVVEDGLTGFLVPHSNPAALAEKFLLLAGDPELRAQFGRAGRERAEAHFDVRTNAQRLLELYGDF
jgi:glycosyltransferase involved in cell wall biosynthesis